MRPRRVSWPVGIIVLAAALLAFSALAPETSADETRRPVWCHDGDRWLGYFDGIPGSASRREITSCLERSAERGETPAIKGWLGDGEVLFMVGDEAFARRTSRAGSLASSQSWLDLTAYDDRLEFGSNGCMYVLRDNSVEFPAARAGRCSPQDSLLLDEEPTDPDFNIYVVGSQFVIDGTAGWYHLAEDVTGRYGDPTPRSMITLYDRYPGLWVGTVSDANLPHRHVVPLSSLRDHPVQQPVAGPQWNWPAYRFFDWEKHVLREAVPPEFLQADSALRAESRDEYWAGLGELVDEIMHDLFDDQVDPVALSRERRWLYDHITIGRTIHLVRSESVRNLFTELSHIVSGQRWGYGPTYAATWLMLWERYVPGFDRQLAVQLAPIHSVEIGLPPPVSEMSDRTTDLRASLFLRAPASPSDHEPIEPSELFRTVELEVGRRYDPGIETLLVTFEEAPSCIGEFRPEGGTPYEVSFVVDADIPVIRGSVWSGLWLTRLVNEEHLPNGWFVRGIPVASGRARVQITTQCPGGQFQEPQIAGYSEIVVVDPNDGE